MHINETKESSRFQILEKPDWVSFDDIADVLHDAHSSTLESGMKFAASDQTGEEIRKRLGDNGTIFIALNEQRIVGVAGVSLYNKCRYWCWRGKPYAEIKLVGVRREYRQQGINNRLYSAAEEYAFRHVDLILMHTAEENNVTIDSNIRHGWKIIDYKSFSKTNYYSVVMALWKNGSPYSDFYRKIRLFFNIFKTKAIYKEGGVYRPLAGELIKRYKETQDKTS